jgi:predicted  nucleic acid-binding Zn-ribbon protein
MNNEGDIHRLEDEVRGLKQRVNALEKKLDSLASTVLLRTEPTAAEILAAFKQGRADMEKAREGISSTQPDPTRRYR